MVAAWIDETEGAAREPELEVVCSSLTVFFWKNVPGEDPASSGSGGMFGPYFAKPRAITTTFGFVSHEHYQMIKKYLAEIGLVVLSDKRLRPAKPTRVSARRAR